jgi:hypothetical protein
VPGEDKVMDTLRSLTVPPGEYRFPFGFTTREMEAPEFIAKMKAGPVGVMTIRPNGELPFGRMMGLWFVYSVLISSIAACVAGAIHGRGAPFEGVFIITSIIAFCCYVVAHWQNWIWWGRSTRITLTYSVDGLLYAIVTGATFGGLWPGALVRLSSLFVLRQLLGREQPAGNPVAQGVGRLLVRRDFPLEHSLGEIAHERRFCDVPQSDPRGPGAAWLAQRDA